MKKLLFPLLFALLLSFGSAKAQEAAKTQTVAASPAASQLELNSKLMGRAMPYQILLPAAYETDKNARFPVLYLLHGLGGSHKDWLARTKLTDYAKNYRVIIVTPEGGNGFYTDSATEPKDKYESYIVQELIPEIDKNYRTLAERKNRAIAGLSMGGYGAIKFGVKYPEMFSFSASMSGAVSAASYRSLDELPNNDWLKKPILAAFGNPDNPTKQANDLYKIFAELPPEKIASLPFFYLDCGTEDALMLLPRNQQLADIMLKRKIPHEFRQLPGNHNWQFWSSQIQEVLRLSDRFFNQQAQAAKN